MKEYRIIDAHAHIFPPKIEQKAVESIGKFYGLRMECHGLSECLVKSGKSINTERFLICSTATKAEQVVSINDFIAQECAKYPDKFIGFGTLHQDFAEYESEIKRMLDLGFYGVKLHPDFQMFNIDDEKMEPVYQKIAEAGLAVLMHTGDYRYDYSSPIRLKRAAENFPKLKFIGAHFGGYRRWKEVENLIKLPNIFFDTSSSLDFLQKGEAERLIYKMGGHRFFFGTDFPMWTHKGEFERFMKLDLDEKTREDVFYNNFAREFNL